MNGTDLQEPSHYFYGVCELDYHLAESIRLTQLLKKSLSTVKFLSGSHFPQIEGYYTQINEMRCGLKRFHSFVCEQKERTCQNQQNANDACSQEDSSEGFIQKWATDGNHDVSLSQLNDLLSQDSKVEVHYSETSVEHKQWMVRNAKAPPPVSLSQKDRVFQQEDVAAKVVPVASTKHQAETVQLSNDDYPIQYVIHEQIQCAEDSNNGHRQQCAVKTSEVNLEVQHVQVPPPISREVLTVSTRYQAKIVHLVHNASFPVNDLW